MCKFLCETNVIIKPLINFIDYAEYNLSQVILIIF